MKNALKDKTVVITGASSGIGEAMAKVYASMGAKVVLGARHADKLEALCRSIEQQGGRAAWCATDVTRPEDCKRLIDTAVEHFGGIDVMICNAGISMRALFDDVDLDVLHRLMDVNFWGTVYCTKYALPYLQKSHGSLVGISSVAGIHGLPGRTGYSASKFAMTGFLETIRIENLKKGVHVMVACAGIHRFERPFLGPHGQRLAAGRNAPQGGEDDDRRAGGTYRRTRHRPPQEAVPYGDRGTCHAFRQEARTGLVDRLFYYVMSKEPDSPFK